MKTLRAIPVAAALALLPALAAAQVEVNTSTQGRTVITNENDAQRGRRLATRLVQPPRADLLPLIELHARRRGLDPGLVRAVVQAESGYNPFAVSSRGAQGLMQLMPETASELAVETPFDPGENLRGGTEYLRHMIERFDGRVEIALAAYNAGPGAVERYGGVPPYPETRGYIERVLSLWRSASAPAVRLATWPGERPEGRPSAERLRPAAQRFPVDALPVAWRRDGERPHLTNIDR